MIFGSHLPAYTSCLVAATGAAALVGADGVSIAEYQGKNKQTKSTHHIQLSVADLGEGRGGNRTPLPPTSQCQGLHSVQKRDLSLSFLVLPQHE